MHRAKIFHARSPAEDATGYGPPKTVQGLRSRNVDLHQAVPIHLVVRQHRDPLGGADEALSPLSPQSNHLSNTPRPRRCSLSNVPQSQYSANC